MAEERSQRRLAAILAADVVGYSRLMEAEEEGTLRRLQGDLRELIAPTIEAHYGRLVKTTGDGLLAEFASVVDAVRCAVAVQRGEEERNIGLSKDRRVLFRIGINLGDVIVENGDLYGDGVNVAARLEGMADAGGVLLSGTAYDQLKKNVDVGFEYLGPQRVKNIAAPVRVYRVLTDPDAIGKTINATEARPKRWLILAALPVLIAVGAVLAWWRPWEPRLEPASVERMALPLPDKPSIVVLPFTNMSGDPQQEYFADGITENLTTDLSNVAGLFVIARNTAFTYKGKTITSARVAEELGVRYLVEGSVQRAGDTVRINAQLIDAVGGGHVWADRFDGSLADIFALQDKVTGAVVNALEVRLTESEQQILGQRDTDVPAAYDAFLQGWGHFRRITPDDFVKAMAYFKQAIALDPDYGRAHAALGLVYYFAYERGWWSNLGVSQQEAYNRAQEEQQKAAKNPTSTYYQALGSHARNIGEAYSAIGYFKKAIALDPSDSWSYAYLAWAELDSGRAGDAAAHIATAIRLDPHYPPEFMHILGLAQLGLGQYADAATTLERAAKLSPDNEYPLLALAAAYGHLGRTTEAAAAVAAYDKLRVGRGGIPLTIDTTPSPTFSRYAPNLLFKQGLRRAGVPEHFEGSEFALRNRLNADEIRTLLVGHRLQGHSPDSGDSHQADIAEDGSVMLSGDWGSFTNGTIGFEDDIACVSASGSKRVCATVLRNPGGSAATENEFIWMDGTGAYSFSQVK